MANKFKIGGVEFTEVIDANDSSKILTTSIPIDLKSFIVDSNGFVRSGYMIYGDELLDLAGVRVDSNGKVISGAVTRKDGSILVITGAESGITPDTNDPNLIIYNGEKATLANNGIVGEDEFVATPEYLRRAIEEEEEEKKQGQTGPDTKPNPNLYPELTTSTPIYKEGLIGKPAAKNEAPSSTETPAAPIKINSVSPKIEKDDKYDSIIKGMDDNTFKKMKRAYGIYEPGDMKDWDHFYIFNRMDPYFQLGTTREYVFFVKPDLHIFNKGTSEFFEPISRNPFFVDLRYRGGNSGRYMKILRNLQKSAGDTDSCPFIRAFTNKIRSGIDLPDIQASDQETATNQFGTRITYRKSSISSDEGFDFTTEFEDNKFLEIYTWFKAYDEYERMKYKGYIKIDNSQECAQWRQYAQYKILHDQMAVFKIVVAENGTDIVYFARIIGVYPKSVNRSAFSELPEDGKLKITTTWHGAFVDDLTRDTISHFNHLAAKIGSDSDSINDLFDSEVQAITGEAMLVPRIGTRYSPRDGVNYYTLNWVPINGVTVKNTTKG